MAQGDVEESFLTVAEVAETLKLNQQTVRNWIDQGSLPALRVGRRVRIKRSDFERLLEACRGHTYGTSHDDLTVRACWDADRLDLTRCGIQPDPRRLLTPAGQAMARALPGYSPSPRS